MNAPHDSDERHGRNDRSTWTSSILRWDIRQNITGTKAVNCFSKTVVICLPWQSFLHVFTEQHGMLDKLRKQCWTANVCVFAAACAWGDYFFEATARYTKYMFQYDKGFVWRLQYSYTNFVEAQVHNKQGVQTTVEKNQSWFAVEHLGRAQISLWWPWFLTFVSPDTRSGHACSTPTETERVVHIATMFELSYRLQVVKRVQQTGEKKAMVRVVRLSKQY